MVTGLGAATTAGAQPARPASNVATHLVARPMLKTLALHTSAAQAEAQLSQLRAAEPEKSAVLQAALNSIRQRAGFNPKNAFSISFKLKWDVADVASNRG